MVTQEIKQYRVKQYIRGFHWGKDEVFTAEEYKDKRMLQYYIDKNYIEEVKTEHTDNKDREKQKSRHKSGQQSSILPVNSSTEIEVTELEVFNTE